MIRTADFSPCRTWRYTLNRVWDKSKPVVLFVLLNPSTADETHDDPTNRRGIGYAKNWGFGGVTFCNLFAVRTPKPEIMKCADDPIGPMNNNWLVMQAKTSGKVILAWGNHGDHMGRSEHVLDMLGRVRANLWCLGKTKSGQPKHILYLRKTLKLMLFRG